MSKLVNADRPRFLLAQRALFMHSIADFHLALFGSLLGTDFLSFVRTRYVMRDPRMGRCCYLSPQDERMGGFLLSEIPGWDDPRLQYGTTSPAPSTSRQIRLRGSASSSTADSIGRLTSDTDWPWATTACGPSPGHECQRSQTKASQKDCLCSGHVNCRLRGRSDMGRTDLAFRRVQQAIRSHRTCCRGHLQHRQRRRCHASGRPATHPTGPGPEERAVTLIHAGRSGRHSEPHAPPLPCLDKSPDSDRRYTL
jgi:hypothetical protein